MIMLKDIYFWIQMKSYLPLLSIFFKFHIKMKNKKIKRKEERIEERIGDKIEDIKQKEKRKALHIHF